MRIILIINISQDNILVTSHETLSHMVELSCGFCLSVKKYSNRTAGRKFGTVACKPCLRFISQSLNKKDGSSYTCLRNKGKSV